MEKTGRLVAKGTSATLHVELYFVPPAARLADREAGELEHALWGLWDDTPEHWFLIALTQTAPAAIRVAQVFTGLTWESLDDAVAAACSPAPLNAR